MEAVEAAIAGSSPVALALGGVTAAVGVWWWARGEGRPPSYPGGPRAERVTYRRPQWPAQREGWKVDPGWRFACGQESHEITERNAPEGIGLTGEAAGRQIWYYDESSKSSLAPDAEFCPASNPNTQDLLLRSAQLASASPSGPVPTGSKVDSSTGGARAAAGRAVEFYSQLQCEDGHWAGDYGGPLFLMPGIVITAYVTGNMDAVLPQRSQSAMVVYLRNHQQTDGGWGTHIESASTMFGTVLCYVSMRLLGVPASDPAAVSARAFMLAHGGALYTGSWAKFWLAVLGVYDWAGVNSIPVEMWLLPRWSPFHPWRMWCHARMVYLPMGYLYCARFVYPAAGRDPLIGALRRELYDPAGPQYDQIDWNAHRHSVADIDNYSPVSWVMRTAQNILSLYERFGVVRTLRRRGLEFAIRYIEAEDQQTNFIDIGPVNKAMNMLCVWVNAGGQHDPAKASACQDFQRHILRVPDYLWVSEDGMKMQGYNGSQCWDTSFAIQAIQSTGLCSEYPDMVARCWNFLERTQILSTETSQATPAFAFEYPANREKYFRHVSQGGWPFSTSAHGWPISDCTAEGLKAILTLKELPTDLLKQHGAHPISDERLFDAVNVLLTLQNTAEGGWATYENTRGWRWFEALNPSEVFGDIMIDYSYVECSAASLSALAMFNKRFPNHRKEEISKAIVAGRKFLKAIQRPDGSWYGSWGCCFTYGCWFGVHGLIQSGEEPSSPCIVSTVKFLLGHQNPVRRTFVCAPAQNGGWGEDFSSCYDLDYAPNGAEIYGTDKSSVVQTSWALLALIEAECKDEAAVRRGIEFLIEQQLPNGDWRQEGISGVFNRSCGISYTQYRNIFPIWALGMYARQHHAHTSAETVAEVVRTGALNCMLDAPTEGSRSQLPLALASSLLWPAALAVPLTLSPKASYSQLFQPRWYDTTKYDGRLRPALGLVLGLSAVAVGQLATVSYHWLRLHGYLGTVEPVQARGASEYSFRDGLRKHLANPEGFIMLGSYLSATWLLNLMPASYYSFEGGIVWRDVASCLVLQDLLQYSAHVAEHSISKAFYRHSHKPHHRFTNPTLFDAFDGSICDTLFMILVPLFGTSRLVHCNVWSYMSFGSLYATWLTLIHSEWSHPWDPVFQKIGFGTAADHHVHHKLFVYNFGHLFMYWDWLGRTYKSPDSVRSFKSRKKEHNSKTLEK